jgi:hypothetical protein
VDDYTLTKQYLNVGYDTPLVFVLTDQNFPPMVSSGEEVEGTCLKIIQIEHGRLAELVGVFLEIAKGFSILAGTVVLLASASHMAVVGTADANIKLRESLSGGVRVIHSIPLLLGGTNNISAIRTMAEINQWVTGTSEIHNNISANRALWDSFIRTRAHSMDCKHIIRLPLTQHKLKLGTYTSRGLATLWLLPP